MPGLEAGVLRERGGTLSGQAVKHRNSRVGQDWSNLGERAVLGPVNAPPLCLYLAAMSVSFVRSVFYLFHFVIVSHKPHV